MDDHAILNLARELVRAPSPTGSEGPAAAVLAQAMRPVFDSVEVDDLGNVVGVLEGRRPGPVVLFNGHTDHVDPGEMDNPYAGLVVDGSRFGVAGEVLYGRGAVDMKAAVAAMVGAASALKASGFRGTLVLTGVVGEETGDGPGTRHVMDYLPLRPNVAVCGEATSGTIGLGHRGRVQFELETIGRTAHASNPTRGVNAVLLMQRFLDALPTLPMPEDPLVGRCSSAVTAISCSPGRLGVVPDRCRLLFDDRFLPGESPDRPRADVEALLARLAAEVPDFRYRLRVVHVMPPYLVDPGAPEVELLAECVAAHAGGPPERRGWLFGTDGTYLVNRYGVATVGYGPGQERTAHTPEEHVPVADLALARDVYATFVRRYGDAWQQPWGRAVGSPLPSPRRPVSGASSAGAPG